MQTLEKEVVEADPRIEELVQRFRKGDQAATEELAAHYKDDLMEYLERCLRGARGDVPSVDDIFIEVWGEAIKSRETFEHRSTFRTWIGKVAENWSKRRIIYDVRDRKRRGPADADVRQNIMEEKPDGSTPPPDKSSKAERQERIEKALAELDPVERKIVVLFNWERLRWREIGEIVGLSRTSAIDKFRQAKAKLKPLLKEFADAGPGQGKRGKHELQ